MKIDVFQDYQTFDLMMGINQFSVNQLISYSIKSLENIIDHGDFEKMGIDVVKLLAFLEPKSVDINPKAILSAIPTKPVDEETIIPVISPSSEHVECNLEVSTDHKVDEFEIPDASVFSDKIFNIQNEKTMKRNESFLLEMKKNFRRGYDSIRHDNVKDSICVMSTEPLYLCVYLDIAKNYFEPKGYNVNAEDVCVYVSL
jgi:hypothetical protein